MEIDRAMEFDNICIVFEKSGIDFTVNSVLNIRMLQHFTIFFSQLNAAVTNLTQELGSDFSWTQNFNVVINLNGAGS
jgi:hypothetical protein